MEASFAILVLGAVLYYYWNDDRRKRRTRQAEILLRMMLTESGRSRQDWKTAALNNGIMVVTEEDFHIWQSFWSSATAAEKQYVSQTILTARDPLYAASSHIVRAETIMREATDSATPTPAPGTS